MNNTNHPLNYLKTEEAKKDIADHFKKLIQKDEIYETQLDRFHKFLETNSLEKIVNKVCLKYESDTYKDRWFNKGFEAPEDLLHFLFDYACKYGRKATKKEIHKYGNMFTDDMYYIKGYYFNMMLGQGSCVKVVKK
jgi:hypothetical protein